MPIESAADRAVFFSPDEFGVAGVYTAGNGHRQATIEGILDQPSDIVVVGERAETIDAKPTFTCRRSDLPVGASVDGGDTLEVLADGEAVRFLVTDIQPDGTGLVLLSLGR